MEHIFPSNKFQTWQMRIKMLYAFANRLNCMHFFCSCQLCYLHWQHIFLFLLLNFCCVTIKKRFYPVASFYFVSICSLLMAYVLLSTKNFLFVFPMWLYIFLCCTEKMAKNTEYCVFDKTNIIQYSVKIYQMTWIVCLSL